MSYNNQQGPEPERETYRTPSTVSWEALHKNNPIRSPTDTIFELEKHKKCLCSRAISRIPMGELTALTKTFWMN